MPAAELNTEKIRSSPTRAQIFEAILAIIADKVADVCLKPGSIGSNMFLAYYITGSSYTMILSYKCARELLFPTSTSYAQVQGLKDIIVEEETLAANSTDQPEQQLQKKKTPLNNKGALISRRGMIPATLLLQ